MTILRHLTFNFDSEHNSPGLNLALTLVNIFWRKEKYTIRNTGGFYNFKSCIYCYICTKTIYRALLVLPEWWAVWICFLHSGRWKKWWLPLSCKRTAIGDKICCQSWKTVRFFLLQEQQAWNETCTLWSSLGFLPELIPEPTWAEVPTSLEPPPRVAGSPSTSEPLQIKCMTALLWN